VNVGVLVSGSGTNLQALLDRGRRGELGPARIAVVGSNVPDCAALARARAAGLPTFVVDHRDYSARAGFDRALMTGLRTHQTDLVVLAGFMRVLGEEMLGTFPGRIINIHPALLPAFAGVRAQRQAYEAGVKVSGCTVHFVDSGVDTGPIIAQSAVLVHEDDDEESLRARILAEEHRLLPTVVRAIAERPPELAFLRGGVTGDVQPLPGQHQAEGRLGRRRLPLHVRDDVQLLEHAPGRRLVDGRQQRGCRGEGHAAGVERGRRRLVAQQHDAEATAREQCARHEATGLAAADDDVIEVRVHAAAGS